MQYNIPHISEKTTTCSVIDNVRRISIGPLIRPVVLQLTCENVKHDVRTCSGRSRSMFSAVTSSHSLHSLDDFSFVFTDALVAAIRTCCTNCIDEADPSNLCYHRTVIKDFIISLYSLRHCGTAGCSYDGRRLSLLNTKQNKILLFNINTILFVRVRHN